jgi:hypothetical protein
VKRELTVFYAKDREGRKVPDVAAHFWCEGCEINLSDSDVNRVERAAFAHVCIK